MIKAGKTDNNAFPVRYRKTGVKRILYYSLAGCEKTISSFLRPYRSIQLRKPIQDHVTNTPGKAVWLF